MRAIIVCNGYLEPDERHDPLVRPGDLVVAADGGSALALNMGLRPQVVIGDMDSLPDEIRASLQGEGCEFVVYPTHKNETDTELAIRYVLQHGAQEVILLGSTGRRLDHALANILLLGMPELAGIQVKIVTADTEIWLLRDTLDIEGHVGDVVTLLPLGQNAIGVSTQGLEYELHNNTLLFGPARGVSNVMIAARARVTLRQGLLLVLHVAITDK
jgi:thiamine pyrophosphokinase